MYEQDWQKPLKIPWFDRDNTFTSDEFYNCVLSRILRKDFDPPWEPPVSKYLTWTPEERDKFFREVLTYIPPKHIPPKYPRLSALTKEEHLSGLKVLSVEYEFQQWGYPSPPTPHDIETFKKIKKIYEKEQNEYKLWASKCWDDGDCIRFVEERPLVEDVYEAQFVLKLNEIQSLPINYKMVNSMILLSTHLSACELQHITDLKSVDLTSLPTIKYPKMLKRDVSILKPYEVPEPCPLHPSRFILPGEKTASDLPMLEIHRRLAEFAVQNGATVIASEKALQCLLEADRSWHFLLSVVEVLGPDGAKKKVLVLGKEVLVQKEGGARRTYAAYRHLLRNRMTNFSQVDPRRSWRTVLFDDDDDEDEDLSTVAHESNDVTNDSNVTTDSETPSCSNQQNQLSKTDLGGVVTKTAFYGVWNIGSGCGKTLKKSNTTTHQPTKKDSDLFPPREPDQSRSSDEEKLVIDGSEELPSTECAQVTNNSNVTSNAGTPRASTPVKNQLGSTETEPIVSDPAGGGVVSECDLQNECGTFKSCKCLLASTKSNDTTHQPADMKDPEWFPSRQPNLSCSSDEEKQLIEDIEQRLSIKDVPIDVTNKSNVTSNAETPSSKLNRLTVVAQSGSATDIEDSVPVAGGLKGVVFYGAWNIPNECGNALKKSIENTSGQSNQNDRSYESGSSYDHTDNSAAELNDDRRRSTESPDAYDDTNNNIALNNAGLSGCCFECNELVDIEPDVSVPLNSKNRENDTKEYFSHYFGSNSNEKPFLDESFRSGGGIGKAKEMHFAGMYRKSDEAGTSRDISFAHCAEAGTSRDISFAHCAEAGTSRDISFAHCAEAGTSRDISFAHCAEAGTSRDISFAQCAEAGTSRDISFAQCASSTMHEAFNNTIEENACSTSSIENIECTCKGNKYAAPAPRSYKKWRVQEKASQKALDLIVHASHKLRERQREVILEPIVEWQPELGARQQSAGRLRALALALMMRPHAKLINVRVDYKDGKIIVIDKLDEERFIYRHGDQRSYVANSIHTVIDSLNDLKPGEYILGHNCAFDWSAMAYSALAPDEVVQDSSEGSKMFSLRPESDFLSEEAEVKLAKVAPELCQAMLQYHKFHNILPLAFTTNKKHVYIPRPTPQLVKPKPPPQGYLPSPSRRRNFLGSQASEGLPGMLVRGTCVCCCAVTPSHTRT